MPDKRQKRSLDMFQFFLTVVVESKVKCSESFNAEKAS